MRKKPISNYHTRKATEGPVPSTRLAGYTLNGEFTPASALPQTSYLDQVKYIGAQFFTAALKSERVELCFGQAPMVAAGVRIEPDTLHRAIDALHAAGGHEELLQELMVLAGLQ